jgi:hypothetical protein
MGLSSTNVKYFSPLTRTKGTPWLGAFRFMNYSYLCHSEANDGRQSKAHIIPTSVTICLGDSHPTMDLAKYTFELQLMLKGNYNLPLYLTNTKYRLLPKVCLLHEVSNSNRPPECEQKYAILSLVSSLRSFILVIFSVNNCTRLAAYCNLILGSLLVTSAAMKKWALRTIVCILTVFSAPLYS